jgi:hypothetical protein
MHKVLRALFRNHWAKLTDADLDGWTARSRG